MAYSTQNLPGGWHPSPPCAGEGYCLYITSTSAFPRPLVIWAGVVIWWVVYLLVQCTPYGKIAGLSARRQEAWHCPGLSLRYRTVESKCAHVEPAASIMSLARGRPISRPHCHAGWGVLGRSQLHYKLLWYKKKNCIQLPAEVPICIRLYLEVIGTFLVKKRCLYFYELYATVVYVFMADIKFVGVNCIS